MAQVQGALFPSSVGSALQGLVIQVSVNHATETRTEAETTFFHRPGTASEEATIDPYLSILLNVLPISTPASVIYPSRAC